MSDIKIVYLGDFTKKYYAHRPQDLKRWSLIYRVGEMDGVDLTLMQVDWKDNKDKNKYDSGEVLASLKHIDPNLIYMVNPRLNDDILYDVGKIYRNKVPIVMTCHDLWDPFHDLYREWNRNAGLSHFIYIFQLSEIYIKNMEHLACKVNIYYDDIHLFWEDNGLEDFLEIWKNKKYDIGRLGRLSLNLKQSLEKDRRIVRSWDHVEVLKATTKERYVNHRQIGSDYANYMKNCRYYLCTPAGYKWGLGLMAATYVEPLACGVIPYGIKSQDKEAQYLISEIFFIEHNYIKLHDFKIVGEKLYNHVKSNYEIVKERFSATSQATKVLEFFKQIIGN